MFVDARRILFEGLIDYAGLFPPASLTMDAAVAEYRAIRGSPDSWMAARFIAPASRLVELASVLAPTMTKGEPTWPIAVILDGDVGAAVAATQMVSAEMGSALQFVFAEVPLPAEFAGPSPTGEFSAIVDAACAISPSIVPFFEIPRTEDWRATLDLLLPMIAGAATTRRRLLGAKLRTGGVTREAFPTSEEVADFILGCSANGVPFKATAGLHHPYRHTWNELDVDRHGFMNLLAAAALADVGAPRDAIVGALDVTDDDAFAVGMSGITVGDILLDVPTLQRIRTTRFPSYGSCSFDEPTDDLRALDLLPKGPT
ncbi:hypothetical protein BMS3Bbin02_00321 [bacterium BMS3Bbin02]|nr:hypothetical protein BMS3Bbin02_00321 [bacterium BMS3Bbin02]